MNYKNQMICANSAIVVMFLVGAGWFFIPGWLPPVDPALDAEAIKAMFIEDRTRIRIGMTLCATGMVFFVPFCAAVSGQMRRIEGHEDPLLARSQSLGSTVTTMVAFFASYFILAAAYRHDMPANVIQIFHDFGWFMIVAAFPPLLIQTLSVGICILGDKSDKKIFPRWLAFVNFWIAILFLPAALVPFLYEGPFAWDGLLSFYIPVFCFFLWIVLMWWFTVSAIRRQVSEAAAAI
ncbi:hypothetical protein EY643_16890 [Halioglobus maricola]|uniref:DUF998 domain-containing protein n=1 Tax=Halioglobus maricola TaxID=2601894 RepID=A0A5P9NNG2_9GAMM|nr:hypothetical protein [Halioglobus maricola]QFU77199.1 hypothetical protein EY643_16890 [Halioglobus maricola]